MKRVFILVLVALLFVSCSDAKNTTEFLTNQGYTNIETFGFDFLAAGKDDWSTTRFTALSPTGKTVKGAVSDKGPLCFFRPRMNIRIWSEK